MESLLEPRLGLLRLLGMTAGLLVAYEVCYRIAHHHRDESREAKKSQVDLAAAALLALLGLLLAFSFEIGESRYDKRKEIVLDEGNAIETTYSRAAMLPSPHDVRIKTLLRSYVQHRVGLPTPEALDRGIRASATLHGDLWAEAAAAAHEHDGSPIVALFVSSLNEMIDLQEARVTVGLFQRLPPAIFTILYVVSLLSIGMLGFRAGLDRTRAWLVTIVIAGAIMSVIGLIDSLDNPTSRLFHVNKYAIEHAMNAMSNSQVVSSAPR